MEIWLLKNGDRDRSFRPLIELETQSNSVYLYDPNGPGFHYGLYDGSQPSCGWWQDIYQQYPSKTPLEVVDKHGRLRKVSPSYYRHGYHYEPLLRNAYPSR